MIAAMDTRLNRRMLLMTLALALAGSSLAYAHDTHGDGDHDGARRALEEGWALPLAEVLGRVRDRLGGEVVGVEFDREDGRYVYEFDVVTPDGRLREIHVDALTAEIIKSEDD